MSSRTRPKTPLDHDPEAVTRLRIQAGLTKTDLARALDKSVSLISEIESGTRNATPAMQIRMARVFGCPRAELERRAESPERGAA